jgi:hypothetical protein
MYTRLASRRPTSRLLLDLASKRVQKLLACFDVAADDVPAAG